MNKILIKFIHENRFRFIIIVVCTVINGIISLFVPVALQSVLDREADIKRIKFISGYLIVTVLLVILEAFLSYIKETSRILLQKGLSYKLFTSAYEKISNIQIVHLRKRNFADVAQQIEMDIDQICMIFEEAMFSSFDQFILMIIGFIGIIKYSEIRIIVLIILVIPFKMIIDKLFSDKRKQISSTYLSLNQRFNSYFLDLFAGEEDMRLNGNFAVNFEKYKLYKNDELDAKEKLLILSQKKSTVSKFDVIFIILVVLSYYCICGKTITIGKFILILTYILYLLLPVSLVMNAYYMYMGIVPSLRRFNTFINLPQELDKSSNSSIEKNQALYIKNLAYKSGNKLLLNNVNIKINPKEKVLIIGKNGSGKSTIIDLILRLREFTSGSILYGRNNIYDYSLKEYRKLFSIVNQRSYLFESDIANIKKNIKKLDQYNLNLDFLDRESNMSNGHNFSDGQRQKLLLARALLNSDNEFLILDEAFSCLDKKERERFVKLFLNTVNKTTIIVSHQKDILKQVDSIIYIQSGKVIQGTYSYLIENSKEFKEYLLNK